MKLECVSVAQYLPSMHKTLDSIPITQTYRERERMVIMLSFSCEASPKVTS